jgi:hypothetical protein
MALKERFKKLTASVAELDSEKLRDYCSRVQGTTRIGDAQAREVISVVGEITHLRIVPRPDGVPWLEATISDDTGNLMVMWTGRRRIAGVSAGKRLIVTGRGAPTGSGGRLLITNPKYELL